MPMDTPRRILAMYNIAFLGLPLVDEVWYTEINRECSLFCGALYTLNGCFQ